MNAHSTPSPAPAPTMEQAFLALMDSLNQVYRRCASPETSEQYRKALDMGEDALAAFRNRKEAR